MYIIIFILGLVLGSFLNAASYRLSNNQSIFNPKRSYCENCKHQLKTIDLIPVLSYTFNKGKCKYCGSHISIIHPIIEILTGILYVCCYKVFGITPEFFIALTLSSFLIMVIVSDINYLIIPDEITLFISILLVILSFIFYGINDTLINIFNGGISFLFMYLLMLFGNLIFKKETLGGADVKLMFIVGFSLGIIPSLFVVFLASLIALPISIILLIRNKENVIPYGPFLVISLLLLYFFQIDYNKVLEIFTLL